MKAVKNSDENDPCVYARLFPDLLSLLMKPREKRS